MNDFNTKLKEQIKKYSNKQYLDKYIQEEYLTEDGEADIFIKLTNKNQLFDQRTVDKQIDLVEDVYKFIEAKTSMLDSTVQIQLHIIGLNLTKEEQGKVQHIIKEHYAIELYKIQKEYAKWIHEIVKLIIIGVFSLSFYAFLSLNTTLTFFMEVLCFMFSFALWQAFENIIYDFRDVKETRKDITQNLLMNVTFDEKEKDIND